MILEQALKGVEENVSNQNLRKHMLAAALMHPSKKLNRLDGDQEIDETLGL